MSGNYDAKDQSGHILNRINEGHAILFLGAGSTIDCRKPGEKTARGLSSSDLAREILNKMTDNKLSDIPLTQTPNLMEASEYFQAIHPGKRTELDKFVQSRLTGLMPTLGHYLATSFPWKAVITTNYNVAAEEAWSDGRTKGFAANDIVIIRTDSDIELHSENHSSTRFYKPHGCINHPGKPDQRMVLTSEDYALSKRLRRAMYEEISKLARENSTIFVGYSLSDYTFRNMYYSLVMDLGPWANRCFSVGPIAPPELFNWKSAAMNPLNTELINTTFDAFMLRLVLKRGTLHSELKKRVSSQWSALMRRRPDAMKGLKKADFLALPPKVKPKRGGGPSPVVMH